MSSVAWSYSNNFNLEAIDLNGEGRIRKVGHTFTYDYYVKDHLGSTREVINDEGAVTEATMYYPYGTMETLLKPPVNDNAREKFTGKELDAGENPASEVSFNIAINNFDAGMHYHGELYVNYTDLVYNRSFLKVYPLQYDADADKFILNTADRFPDSMRVTNLRIATSGAVSPINYEKACDYTVVTDSGLVIALDTSGSALINSSGVNYFTDSTYTPERVAGSNLYYFGARYYDAELGVWGSCDKARQYFNSYSYTGGGPIIKIDVDGYVAIYVNGINGTDDPKFRTYLAQNNSQFGGTEYKGESAAFWGKNWGYLSSMTNTKVNLVDLAFAFGGNGLTASIDGFKLQQDYDDAYAAAQENGEPFYVVGHSGGNLTSGYATAIFNMRKGYNSVDKRYTVNGADAGSAGTNLSLLTGTKTESYYNPNDVVSYYGSAWDFINPITAILDPSKNLDAIDLYNWQDNMSGHNGKGKQFLTNGSLGGSIRTHYLDGLHNRSDFWGTTGYGILYAHTQPYHWVNQKVQNVTDWWDERPFALRATWSVLKGDPLDITKHLIELFR